MKNARLSLGAVAMLAFVLLSLACSGISQGIQAGKDAMNLQLIGQAYKSYCSSNNKGPANADELMKSANTQQEKDAVQAVKDGTYEVVWNVNLSDGSSGGSGAVLANAKTAINGVRVALMADGSTVTTFPEADFLAKPKATPGGKAAGDGGKVKEKEKAKAK